MSDPNRSELNEAVQKSTFDLESAASKIVWFDKSPDKSMIKVGSYNELRIMSEFIEYWNYYEKHFRLGSPLFKSDDDPEIHELYHELLLSAIHPFYRYYVKNPGGNKLIFDRFRLSLYEATANARSALESCDTSELVTKKLIRIYDIAALLLNIALENEIHPEQKYREVIENYLTLSCQLRKTEFAPTNTKQELQRICQELPSSFDETTLYGKMAIDCLATQAEKYKEEDQNANQATAQTEPLEPSGHANPNLKQPANDLATTKQFVPLFPELYNPQEGVRQRHPKITSSEKLQIINAHPPQLPPNPSDKTQKKKSRSTTSAVLSRIREIVAPIFENSPTSDKRQPSHPKSDRERFENQSNIHMSSTPSSSGSENSDYDLARDSVFSNNTYSETDLLLPDEHESLTDEKDFTDSHKDTDPLLPQIRCS